MASCAMLLKQGKWPGARRGRGCADTDPQRTYPDSVVPQHQPIGKGDCGLLAAFPFACAVPAPLLPSLSTLPMLPSLIFFAPRLCQVPVYVEGELRCVPQLRWMPLCSVRPHPCCTLHVLFSPIPSRLCACPTACQKVARSSRSWQQAGQGWQSTGCPAVHRRQLPSMQRCIGMRGT